VGQKIHPNGFRIGINKQHDSRWFSNYATFSTVLKEDFQIRKLFKTKFDSIYHKAGIYKLEIRRKINQLELLIYAARPKVITVELGESNLIAIIKEDLKKCLTHSKQIRIKVYQVEKNKNESLLVARSIAEQLEKRVAFRKAIRQTSQMLKKSKVEGFKIQVAGRLNGAEIARVEWFREGRVPLQTLRADIGYASQSANTIYGILGIKVWIFHKEIF
jgi:small subunit ribosomal protein S3